MTVEEVPDTKVFRLSVKQRLGPTRASKYMVVTHNLLAHKAASVQQALACRQAQPCFLLHSSPDVSRRQRCTSMLKIALRAAKARTREGLGTAIRKALETITAADA
jgi:hypothetical protein